MAKRATNEDLGPYINRTEEKLRFAKLHLDELRKPGAQSSVGDNVRAYEEAFLYHLIGARDAFYQELNVCYSCGLKLWEVTANRLREKLKMAGPNSPEFVAIERLEKEPTSWLCLAIEFRNHGTHRAGSNYLHEVLIPAYSGDGKKEGEPEYRGKRLIHPRTGRPMEENVADLFEDWFDKMKKLLAKHRETAKTKLAGVGEV